MTRKNPRNPYGGCTATYLDLYTWCLVMRPYCLGVSDRGPILEFCEERSAPYDTIIDAFSNEDGDVCVCRICDILSNWSAGSRRAQIV